jgi:protein-export membrane protein SecD
MIGLLEIKQAIPNFSSQATGNVQIHEVEGITYIIDILDKKTPNEKRFGFLTVHDVDEAAFEKALQSKTYYTIEEVFIQDQLSWMSAQTTDGKILNGTNFKYASVSNSQMGQPVVVLNFDETGKTSFCNITENNIGKQMAIFIGGTIITAPTIQSKICDGSAQIDGQFTPESAKELTASLNNGALPAPLILMQEEKISPSLGDSALSGAIIALIIGIIAICTYMIIVYGLKKGLITLISTLVYTLVLLAIIKLIDYALSLSGIAAIILSIGMAIDANILIFERMKEEKKEGKANDVAIKIAYERSRAAIKDAQLSTGLIGLLLFMMGINMFKGFGSMLVIGVILTLLINVPIIKDLLFLFYPNKESKEKSASK